jgi:hypothetical protein
LRSSFINGRRAHLELLSPYVFSECIALAKNVQSPAHIFERDHPILIAGVPYIEVFGANMAEAAAPQLEGFLQRLDDSNTGE